MVNIAKNSNKIAYGIKHFNVDEEIDITNLNKSQLTPGSTVFVINTSKYYMLNGKKQWIAINPYSTTGNSSSGGNSGPNDDDNGIYDGGSIDSSDPN